MTVTNLGKCGCQLCQHPPTSQYGCDDCGLTWHSSHNGECDFCYGTGNVDGNEEHTELERLSFEESAHYREASKWDEIARAFGGAT